MVANMSNTTAAAGADEAAITYSATPVLTIEVPGRAVSANARLGYNRHTGAKYLTKAARLWKEAVAEHAWFECGKGHIDALHLALPLRIVIHVYGTQLDSDNANKLILDGLKEGIGIDDKHYQSVTTHVYRAPRKQPRMVIQVFEAEA